MFCHQHGETALQLAKRSDCQDIVTLIAAHKKVIMNLGLHMFTLTVESIDPLAINSV